MPNARGAARGRWLQCESGLACLIASDPDAPTGAASNGTCATPLSHGAPCDPAASVNQCAQPLNGVSMNCERDAQAAATGTAADADAPAAASAHCRWSSQLGGKCETQADCNEGKCTGGVCVGTVGEGGACNFGADSSCAAGLFCNREGKCLRQSQLGGPCSAAEDGQCAYGECNGAATPPVCVGQFSLADGQLASEGDLCHSSWADPTTHKCSSTRAGATAATGDACATELDCKAAADLCACGSDGQSVCMTALTSDFMDDFNAAQTCIADNKCPNDENPFGAGSCISTHCEDEFEAVECDQMQLFIKVMNGGTFPTGDVGDALNKNLDTLYNCDSVQHGGLGAGAIVGIIVGVVVVIGLGAYCMTQRRKARENQTGQYSAMA